MCYQKNQILNCFWYDKKINDFVLEEFEIVKVARKYVYCVSNQYSSDGLWRFEKKHESEIPEIKRF